MKIAIVSDAWHPQVNGVVRTISKTTELLEGMGHEIRVIWPDQFVTLPCPTYPEIRLALKAGKRFAQLIESFQPDAIHVATEGPLGMAARSYCLSRHYPFTTSFHTRFPEYVKLRFGIPVDITYKFLRWFHARADCTMVATESLREELRQRGIEHLALWTRGVDTELFRPRDKGFLPDPRPIFMYAGRVAVEKNIESFLNLNLPGTKYVIGDGPDLHKLRSKYPAVKFTGFKVNGELARHIAAADVFVFPSRTDTFGLVMLEAMACGVPVAAYPVPGPGDVVRNGVTGFLDDDLERAAVHALSIDGRVCREFALGYSWAACTAQFLGNLSVIRPISYPSNARTA